MPTRKTPRFPISGALLAGLLLLMPFAPSQGKGSQVPVYVSASFIDKNNLFIENLTHEEIEIREEGKPRPAELIVMGELPSAYGIIFERGMMQEFAEVAPSRRTGPQIGSAGDIAFDLIDKHLSKQVVWIGVYDKELEVLADFTSDGFRAKDAIQKIRSMRRPRESFLYGALVSAVQKMNERAEKRRVLILFVESVDSQTVSKSKPLRNLFSSSNVELFTVSFATRLGSNRFGISSPMGQALLKDLSGVTAGESFSASEYREHLDDISRRLYNQIRTLYTFGFSSGAEPGKTARLTVRCSRAGAKVRHHPTFLASP